MEFLYKSDLRISTVTNSFNPRKKHLSINLQGFNGTVVNRALPSLHGGSLEITLTIPLNCCKIYWIIVKC